MKGCEVREYDSGGPRRKPTVTFYRAKLRNKWIDRLAISHAAGVLAGLDQANPERVNVGYTPEHPVYECPVLTIRRGGSHLSMAPDLSRKSPLWYISMTMVARQLGFPIPTHKLPVLDYVDQTIYVDMTAQPVQEQTRRRLWRTPWGTPSRTTLVVTGHGGPMARVDFRTNKEWLELLGVLAEEEGKSRTAFMLDAVQWYVEDVYAERFERHRAVQEVAGKGIKKRGKPHRPRLKRR